MRNGELPFRDIFSSQGPVFLPLLWVADLVGLRTMDAPRLLSVASGVLLTVAVYSSARHLTSRGNALFAAALVTTSGSVLWVTVPVNADGPSLALSVLAVAFALRYRADPRLRNAVWMGLAAGGAVSIKALSVPALVIAGLVVLLSNPELRTGVRDAAVAAGIAVGVYVVTALPFGIADVWNQSYSYHQEAKRIATSGGAFHKLVDTLWDRDKLVLVALALAAITWAVRFVVRRRAGRAGDRALTIVVAFLVLWVVMVVALLVWEPAMWRAHVAHVVPPLALLAALKPPSWKVLVIAGVLTVPFAIASNTSILWPGGYTGEQAALVQRLERFPADRAVHLRRPGARVAIRARHARRLRRHVVPAPRRPQHHPGVAGEGGHRRRRVRRGRDVTRALRAPGRPARRARRARLPPGAVRPHDHALRARHVVLLPWSVRR